VQKDFDLLELFYLKKTLVACSDKTENLWQKLFSYTSGLEIVRGKIF